MTGGLDGSWTTLSSTVFVYTNGTVETGPQLPEARSGHCMVTLHDGKVLILGANPNSPSLYRNVIIFDPAQKLGLKILLDQKFPKKFLFLEQNV